jgi:hypothetical protein
MDTETLRTLARANSSDKAREERSHADLIEAIWEADGEGWQQVDIVHATGLTRERIRQICRPGYKARIFTFGRHPQAKGWASAHRAELDAMEAEISEVTGISDPEWLAVRTWLVVTHPDGDTAQCNRRLTDAIMRRLNGQKLSDAVQVILEKHLPALAA